LSPRNLPAKALPLNVESIRGLRVAAWLRESTSGQFDFYGPLAQAQLIAGAIERHGLLDTGIRWTVAASGWKHAWLTPEWEAMLEGARRGDFDVLLIAYVSRFLRNLKQTLIAIEDQLHPAGVTVYFIDERILSSDPDDWHALVEEATDAERYSRKMAKRQREGHAAKRRLGEPGGRPPYGFCREGRPPVLVEITERIARVRLAYELAAEGSTDRDIAARVRLAKSHVSEILTNPIYRGVLRDESRRAPVIDEALWSSVQEMRQRHSHRHPGPTTYRQYLWSGLLRCRACGRRLIGHGERYRHVEACEAFRMARPEGADARVRGESYASDVYDAIAPRALSHVVANAQLLAEVQDAIAARAPRSDEFALARIRRERQQARQHLEEDGDPFAFRATWERLDREERDARVASSTAITPSEVAVALGDLRAVFDAAEPGTQHRIVQALFEQVEVLGPNEVWLYPSVEAEARGWATAMSGEFQVEIRQSGRGERT
jgi:DNA invertase Pin-like site-specific DNA recombinase